MRSDPMLPQVDWARRTEPAELPEWMDEPCSDVVLQACLRDLDRVNKLTLGYRPTLAFLERLLAVKGRSTKLRILDVGFGGGDALRRIAHWARERDVTVELTGVDLNPIAVRLAQEQHRHADIKWLCGDALAYRGEIDVVLSSLLTHHLPTPDVLKFVGWMEEAATLGWFVNDLERSARSASLFAMLSRVMRWHLFVQHDGPVSFARGFVPDDWRRILSEAGVPPGVAEIAKSFPGRLCIGRFK